jgi:non-specific serine/threonine protein kinase
MLQRELDELRAALGQDRFEAAWHAGRELSVSEAVAATLPITSSLPSAPTSAPKLRADAALTPRELEVTSLIARGRSNREIAEELVIAVSTAERHVANILGKLNLTSRAQVIVWAIGQGTPYSG